MQRLSTRGLPARQRLAFVHDFIARHWAGMHFEQPAQDQDVDISVFELADGVALASARYPAMVARRSRELLADGRDNYTLGIVSEDHEVSVEGRPGITVRAGDLMLLNEGMPRDDLLAPLLAECRPSQVFSQLVRDWSVNGIPGGDALVGTVAVEEDRRALYTAPAVAPQPPAVAVSTEYRGLEGERVLLVANILVQAGLCTPPGPAQPCQFDLTTFNGKGLPYEELPREDWQNPETIVSGRLTLMDDDDNGDGTWTARIHWVEERMSGPLEQFEQLAGDFTSSGNGQLEFTVVGGGTFGGRIEHGRVTLSGYPFTSKNTSVTAELEFVPQ